MSTVLAPANVSRLLSVFVPVLVGAAAAKNPQLALLLAVGLVGAFALAAPAAGWVVAAIIAAITFKGLVTLGVLPSVATFMDIPLAWGALTAALLRRSARTPDANRYLRWILVLAAAVFIAAMLNGTELLRPVLYLGLLGEPFAIVGALLVDPPSPQARKTLLHVAAGLVAIQVPLAYVQFASHSNPDRVQGTLWGAGAGAHTMSGIVAVGAFWLLSKGHGRIAWRRLALICLMLGVLFIADAKQVIFALPALALAVPLRRGRVGFIIRGTAVAVSIAALVSLPAGQTAIRFLQKDRTGASGKQAAAEFVWQRAKNDPTSLFVGQGPAETVSRSAFMTTDFLLQPNSPIRVLNLAPAKTAIEAQDLAQARSGGGTSANTGLSSALGVFGDIGLFGAFAYAGLLGLTFVSVRRRDSAEAEAAAGGWALFAVLGFVFDWWEQPPLAVLLGVLTALALTARSAEKLRAFPDSRPT